MKKELRQYHLDHTGGGGRNHNSGDLSRHDYGAKLILGNQSRTGTRS